MAKLKLPTVTCPTCKGAGQVEDEKQIGPLLRAEREKAGISALAVSKKMGLPKATLFDWETGRRGKAQWTKEAINDYRAAVKELKAEKIAAKKGATK